MRLTTSLAASAKRPKPLTPAFKDGNKISPILAASLVTLSVILLNAPVNVSDILSVLPAIPAAGSTNVASNALRNSGNVILLKSSILEKLLTRFNTPRSLNISAAPAPPAKARPSELAASVAVVPINAARSATGLIIPSASAPNAFNCAPASTTS